MAITIGSKSLKSNSRKTRDAVNQLHDGSGRVLKISAAAVYTVHGVGKNASSTEQGITANGLAVGDIVWGVFTANTSSPFTASHFRSTVLTINTLNQLTASGNRVGELFTILALNQTAL